MSRSGALHTVLVLFVLALSFCGYRGYIEFVQEAHSASATDNPMDGKARLIITAESLRGFTTDVQIDGKQVASVGQGQPYKGEIALGRHVITVKGGQIEIDAQRDHEYLLRVQARPASTGSRILFGLAATNLDYMIVLQETRTPEEVQQYETAQKIAEKYTPELEKTFAAAREENDAKPENNAIAVAKSPSRWVWGTSSSRGTAGRASQEALENCKNEAVKAEITEPCKVYSVNGRVVYQEGR